MAFVGMTSEFLATRMSLYHRPLSLLYGPDARRAIAEGRGGALGGSTSIGFNAPNTAGSPEFKDANGNSTTSLANAVSLQNTTPSPVAGTVNTLSDRSREFQYSIRFTF